MENIYFDEYIDYLLLIKDRRNAHYIMLLSISTNPHLDSKDQKQLWETLQSANCVPEEVDVKANLEQLKFLLGQNPRFLVK